MKNVILLSARALQALFDPYCQSTCLSMARRLVTSSKTSR